MTPSVWFDVGLEPALGLLPQRMDTPAARALLLTIALQESRLIHRKQVRGPARGFLQFEVAGVRGVLAHRASRSGALAVCRALDVPSDPADVQQAMQWNDPLACAFGRLLLWTLPQRLPSSREPAFGWRQYLAAWRPGKPHPDTWARFYAEAWEHVGHE